MMEVTFYDQTFQLELPSEKAKLRVEEIDREIDVSVHWMRSQIVEFLSLTNECICIEYNGEKLSDETIFSWQDAPIRLNVILLDQLVGGKGGNIVITLFRFIFNSL